MKPIYILIMMTSLMSSFIVTVAYAQDTTPDAQTPQPSPTPEESPKTNGGVDLSFGWIIISLISGALGGLVYELIMLEGRIEFPHRSTPDEKPSETSYAIVQYMYDLGTFARLIIGALAALVALWATAPITHFSQIAISVLAGSAGVSIFRSLQDRLLAAIAQKEAADTKEKAGKQAAIVKMVSTEFATLKELIDAGSTNLPGEQLQSSLSNLTIQNKLDKIEEFLNQAAGISMTY